MNAYVIYLSLLAQCLIHEEGTQIDSSQHYAVTCKLLITISQQINFASITGDDD